MTRPNILFCFSDQQRWDTCGCYGQPLDVTPELDRMAADGVRFDKAFSCQPVCGPARACLQTGLWATETGCVTNGIALPRDAKTVAHHLGDSGYQTAYIGKWHLATNHRGKPGVDESEVGHYETKPIPPALRGGFRDFWLASDVLEFTSHSYDGHMFDSDGQPRSFPEGRYRADAQTDWLIDWLANGRDRKRPFYAFCSWIEPHHQNDHNCYEGPHGSKQRWHDFVAPGDLVGEAGDWREQYPDYLGCINSLDANMGRIRACLESQGIWDNTIVIYTSDHGSHFRTRNREYKRSCHDACIRVPLIIHGPGFTGGQVVEHIASLIDLPRTILTAAGVPIPKRMRGHDLASAVAGETAEWPEDAFLQISESQCGRALRTRRWTYSVRDPESSSGARYGQRYVEDFLYDNEADPHQQHNLVSDPAHAAVREELRARMLARMVAAGEPPAEIVPAPSDHSTR